jgi:hypothetical protein
MADYHRSDEAFGEKPDVPHFAKRVSYDFSRLHAKPEPGHTTPFMVCSGGVWRGDRLVVVDRVKVSARSVFALRRIRK